MTDPSSLLVGLRVLVADDEAFSLSIIGRMLREMGCKDVLQADNGAKAFGLFQAESQPPIKLAIVDFNMPDLNGLQLLKLIRTGKTAAARNLPVLMLTGTADGGLVSAAAALDIGAFVVKPVSKATLSTRIAKALAEPREPKPAAHYDGVDIDTVGKALLLSHKPVGGAKARADRITTANGVKLRLEAVPIGAVLAEDIRGPDGELLLGRGALLSERFLRRLRDLSGVARIEYLIIEQPKKSGFP
ncbi:MAG TPA: response regulator [Magnetospirillaceae bacterium]|nr:response regulator [Magnetospirillaceae bacterium]